MKKVILSSIIFAVTLMAHAQSAVPEVEQKIAQMENTVDSLKSTITAMQTSMASLQAKIDEVIKLKLDRASLNTMQLLHLLTRV